MPNLSLRRESGLAAFERAVIGTTGPDDPAPIQIRLKLDRADDAKPDRDTGLRRHRLTLRDRQGKAVGQMAWSKGSWPASSIRWRPVCYPCSISGLASMSI